MVQATVNTSTPASAGTERPNRYRVRVIAYNVVARPTLLALAWLWRVFVFLVASILVGSLLGNAFVSLITTGSIGLSDPRNWAIVQPFLQDPREAALFGGPVLVLALISYLGSRAASRIIPPDLRIFEVTPVRKTPSTKYIRNYNPFYIRRQLLDAASIPKGSSPVDADASAQTYLRTAEKRAIRQGRSEKIGFCVWGDPMLGTTRLAWEAVNRDAKSWTFVAWPEYAPLDKWDELFRILQRRRAKIVLWLDNLSKYARVPGAASYINSLPDVLDAHGLRYVVVVTCNEQDANGPIHHRFEPLLQRLDNVRPARMTEAEMRELAVALTRSGQVVGFNEKVFDGLPGTIVLGVSRMRDEVYPSLGQPAQLVLKTIKLLRSAGVSEYTFQRVIVTARDVFHLQPEQITSAIEILKQTGFLTLGNPTSEGQPTVLPSTDFFFDVAVPDYPVLADAVADWPLLQQCLERIKDGKALAQLGDSFRDELDYAHAEHCYEVALPSFKRRSAPLEWASVQYGLGLVLAKHAAELQDQERTAQLERAQDCFTNVLSVVNQQNDPATWVGALEAWREVLRREPHTTRTPSRIQSIEKALEAAKQEIGKAKGADAIVLAEAQLNLGVLQLLQARLESNAGSRWHMLNRAISTLEQAVSLTSAESNPSLWARAQSCLGDVCRARADAATKVLRIDFLSRAAQAYQAALSAAVAERTHREEAELQVQLGETLSSLATLKDTPERIVLQQQAVEVLRHAVGAYGRRVQQYPIERAEAQLLLAQALGDIATGPEEDNRIGLLTQAIIEYEDAIGVLDPDGTDRADEIRVRTAELLLQRAQARQASQPDEAGFDLHRVAALCDEVVKRDGSRDRNRGLYKQAQKLRQEATALMSSGGHGSALAQGQTDAPR